MKANVEYRIVLKKNMYGESFYVVQMWHNWFWWVTIKAFKDEDMDFAKREAEELLEKLEEK